MVGESAEAALTISLSSATNNSTANTSTGNNTDKREFNSLLSTVVGSDTDGDYIGSSATISTVLRAMTGADKDSNTNTTVSTLTQNGTVNYTLNFSVANPGAGRIYDLTIDTRRFGELTILNESTGHGGSATLTLGGITALYSGPGTPVGSNNLAGATLTSPNSNNSSQYITTAVNQSGSVTISGLTGAQAFSIGFSWAQNASSQNAGGLFNNGQGDDGAIRLGRSRTTNATAGLYPGFGSRDINLDGHFVDITATITAIPEPSSALALTGLAGLAGLRRRRSQS
jgi:hypothetical protein